MIGVPAYIPGELKLLPGHEGIQRWNDRWKVTLFREKHTSQTVWAVSEADGPHNVAWLVSVGWVIF